MEFSDSNVALGYTVLVLNNIFKKASSFIYFDYVMARASCDFLKYFFWCQTGSVLIYCKKVFTICKNLMF